MSESTSAPFEFDFDAWSRLHVEDPDAFERRRIEAIEAIIRSAPTGLQPRLRGLQFRVEMERSRAGSDLAACVKSSAMMWDSLIRLRDALEDLTALQAGSDAESTRAAGSASRPPTESAQVIAFPGALGIAEKGRQD